MLGGAGFQPSTVSGVFFSGGHFKAIFTCCYFDDHSCFNKSRECSDLFEFHLGIFIFPVFEVYPFLSIEVGRNLDGSRSSRSLTTSIPWSTVTWSSTSKMVAALITLSHLAQKIHAFSMLKFES